MKFVSNAGTGLVLDLIRPWLKVDNGLGMASPTRSLFAFVKELALGLAAWRKEQAPAGETTAVFRDSAFENDVAKSSLAAILQQHGIAQVQSL